MENTHIFNPVIDEISRICEANYEKMKGWTRDAVLSETRRKADLIEARILEYKRTKTPGSRLQKALDYAAESYDMDKDWLYNPAVEEIHRIREKHYERTKDWTLEQVCKETRETADKIQASIDSLRGKEVSALKYVSNM